MVVGRRKLRLASCRACRRMLAVAVTGDEVTPYREECADCGSSLDGNAAVRTAVVAGD